MVYFPVDIEKAVERVCNRRRYSERTIKTYLYCINRFLKYTKKSLDRISKKDVRLFLEYLSERKMAGSTMNVYHMSIRFLFEDVLDKRMWINIKYSKVPEKLPLILSKKELKKLFNAIENDKHRLMAKLMYSAGLRVSELVNLRVEDIHIDRSYGFVRKGKGNKDRIFIVADSLKEDLKKFIGSATEGYLLISQRKSKYNPRSLQQIIEKARKKAKIRKKISCHTLRHSFATHLVEDGCSVFEIQSLLGHKSPETTMVYLHVKSPSFIKVKSPLDSF
jgi:integrase/recombinase XerD